MKVQHGQLVAIVGQVGTGKSSLICSLLGELIKLQGLVKVKVLNISEVSWMNLKLFLTSKKYLYVYTMSVSAICGAISDTYHYFEAIHLKHFAYSMM